MQQGGAAPAGRRQRNWLGWGLALFILGACAVFLDLDQVFTILSRIHPAAIVGLLTMLLGGLKDQALAQSTAERSHVRSPSDAEGPSVAASKPVNPVLDHPHHMARLGAVLFSQHLVSVELAGTLLLAALVGAVAIAAHGKRRLATQIEDAMRLEEAAP